MDEVNIENFYIRVGKEVDKHYLLIKTEGYLHPELIIGIAHDRTEASKRAYELAKNYAHELAKNHNLEFIDAVPIEREYRIKNNLELISMTPREKAL